MTPKKEFTDRMPIDILYERYRLTPDLIAADVSATSRCIGDVK